MRRVSKLEVYGLSAPGPGNIIVVKEGKNARCREEKKRLRKKPRGMEKKIEAVGYFGTDVLM